MSAEKEEGRPIIDRRGFLKTAAAGAAASLLPGDDTQPEARPQVPAFLWTGPKAKLALFGGGNTIDDLVITLLSEHWRNPSVRRKKENLVVLVTGATQREGAELEQMKAIYQHLFAKRGFRVHFIHDRKDADAEGVEALLEKAALIYFTGGDQEKLDKICSGTRALRKTLELYLKDALAFIAGTSAGAAVMSNPMIAGWHKDDHKPSDTKFLEMMQEDKGFGFVSAIVDTHLESANPKRISRIERGLNALKHWFGKLPHIGMSIGLGENMGIVVQEGWAEVVGSKKNGRVSLFQRFRDGKEKIEHLAAGTGFSLGRHAHHVERKSPPDSKITVSAEPAAARTALRP